MPFFYFYVFDLVIHGPTHGATVLLTLKSREAVVSLFSNSVAGKTRLNASLSLLKPAIFNVLVFGFFINMLSLAAPLYMLQIYDRVLSSRSIPTLLVMTLILGFIYIIITILEIFRSKIMLRSSIAFDRDITPDVFRSIQDATLKNPSPRHTQALRDVGAVRDFYSGPGMIAFCDFPWVPIFIGAAFLLHPIYGYMAIIGGCISFIFTLLNSRLTKNALDSASQSANSANNQAIITFRNAEVIHAMGMIDALRARWTSFHENMLAWQAIANNRANILVSITKFNRMFLQSLVLGVGAYLVIIKEVTPGTMIAASIIVGKALAPVEVGISQWKSFSNMREAKNRIIGILNNISFKDRLMPLPRPVGHLVLANASATAPGHKTLILKNLNLNIEPGTIIGVIGPSAAGKSSLARLLVGIWNPINGSVRLDGSELSHWPENTLGEHIGYLPQDIELFSGTIAENISRFSNDADETDIINAAKSAGVHDMIQKLPKGYNTSIGDSGQALSAGQRQRIGLARALYKMPPIIILDEPNSNLDSDGERALMASILSAKSQGSTVILITHKMNIISSVDKIAIMNNGTISKVGSRDEIMSVIAPTLKTVSQKQSNIQM